MSCILRISGDKLDIDKLSKNLSIKPYGIFKKGDPVIKSKPEGRKIKCNEILFLASNADFDKLDKQIKDSIKFLQKNKLLIKRMTLNKFTDESVLDFGFDLRIGYNNVASQSDYFPFELLKICGELKIDLGVSLYPPDVVEQVNEMLNKENKNL